MVIYRISQHVLEGQNQNEPLLFGSLTTALPGPLLMCPNVAFGHGSNTVPYLSSKHQNSHLSQVVFTIDGALSIHESKLLGGLIVGRVGYESHFLNFSGSLEKNNGH